MDERDFLAIVNGVRRSEAPSGLDAQVRDAHAALSGVSRRLRLADLFAQRQRPS